MSRRHQELAMIGLAVLTISLGGCDPLFDPDGSSGCIDVIYGKVPCTSEPLYFKHRGHDNYCCRGHRPRWLQRGSRYDCGEWGEAENLGVARSCES